MNISNINCANRNKQDISFRANLAYKNLGDYPLDGGTIANLEKSYASSFRDPSHSINFTVFETETNGNILREIFLSYIKNTDFPLGKLYREVLSKSASKKKPMSVTILESLAKFFDYVNLADPPAKEVVKQAQKPRINKPKLTLVVDNSKS